MKKIDLATLVTGTTTEYEYFSEDGDLLLARGVLLTERHLEMLKHRNILDLYIEKTDEESMVHEVLSADYSKHHSELPSDLDIGRPNAKGPSSKPGDQSFQIPRALDTPELKNISSGEAGFKQLAASKKAVELDNRLMEGRCIDQPTGMPLKDKLRQIGTKERNDDYKKLTIAIYNDLFARTKSTLDSLADAKRLEYTAARAIVEKLLKVLMNDRCFLLAIASQRQEEEEHLYSHSLRVSIYALCIAVMSGYNQHQVMEIGIGALLHDIGMLLVPRTIRLKKGKLDKDEWYEIMKHPVLGIHLLEKIDRLPEWIPYMAYQCHERENGKGYPKQRSGRFIHNYAKMCAIADMFEAFSSPRPYREAYIPCKALELVVKASRQGLVSSEFTQSLVQCLSLFPVGSVVELNNKSIGIVVRVSPTSFSKPTVCVVFDGNGNELTGGPREIDLAAEQPLSIVKAHPDNYRGISWKSGF